LGEMEQPDVPAEERLELDGLSEAPTAELGTFRFPARMLNSAAGTGTATAKNRYATSCGRLRFARVRRDCLGAMKKGWSR
jgi:hypothetical protein